MISGDDFYKVMCAVVPLYFAMLVAYGSVKWGKIFSPEQCSGINRFVVVFAVPILSFHFISQNNPYEMEFKLLMADTVSKVLVLVSLSVWVIFRGGGLDWLITLFSLFTLPNTLVMGIPLLKSMYGDITQTLMVQILVLQCIIWYSLLLFLFEYRAATILIQNQFPGHGAASITKFDIEGDVISLDGLDALHTDSKVDVDGSIRVCIRRSISSSPDSSSSSPPKASNLANPPLSPDALNLTEVDSSTVKASNTPVRIRSPAGGGGVKVAWESPGKPQIPGGEGGRQGCREAFGEKDLSFSDSSKITVQIEEDSNGKATDQEMPHPLVMLRLILIIVGRKLSCNPNTYASILGLIWSLIAFKWNVVLPILVIDSIQILADAGLGMAMFSLGLFMALQPNIIACGTKMATIGMVIRFVGGPIIMSTASFAVGLRGVELHTAMVQAALPQGIVPFVFAREYDLHPDILSTGVIFGMLVALPVTLLYYILLGL